MRWSKVKQLVEERFAKRVQGRVHVYSTHYQCPCGRGWITIDREELVDFSTMLSGLKYHALYHETTKTPCARHPAIRDEDRTPGNLVEPGEFSRFDLHKACWEFLHTSIDQALASPNPLLVALALLDARVGKRRLQKVQAETLHPLANALFKFRKQVEGMT